MGDALEPAERARLIADVQAQAEELSALVADLIELARGDEAAPAREDVRLDALVAEAIDRARRHARVAGPSSCSRCRRTSTPALGERLGRGCDELFSDSENN